MRTLPSWFVTLAISGIFTTFSNSAFAAAAQVASGQLTIRGELGPSQKFALVKAQRCEKPTVKSRNSKLIPSVLQRNCQAPVYFELNTPTSLPVGQYLLGFENTIYPGLVEVQADTNVTFDLEKIEIPAAFSKEKQVRVYRDFSALVEQRKIYLSIYYTGAHFFRLTKYSFGDFYLTSKLERDYFQIRTFKPCANLWSYQGLRAHAKFVCNTWNNAKSMMEMADLYRFDPAGGPTEGTFQEALYFEPGDIQAVKHGKYLVSVPFEPSSFVSVFPGVYRISVDGKNIPSIRVETAPIIENYPDEDLNRELRPIGKLVDVSPEFQNAMSPDQQAQSAVTDTSSQNFEKCDTARVWRTESRSYCSSDKAEGCDRQQAQKCEVMNLDLRFRK